MREADRFLFDLSDQSATVRVTPHRHPACPHSRHLRGVSEVALFTSLVSSSHLYILGGQLHRGEDTHKVYNDGH